MCDEITTALDEHGTALVVELLNELTAQGTALVWISHDLGLVAAVSDHVLVLDAYRVIEEGPPSQVMDEPTTELTHAAGEGRPGRPRRASARADQ